VTEHSASKNVEDARDRLAALNAPIPKPTAEQIAASEALENSRAQYRLTDRAKLLVFHTPDVVTAAKTGEPTLEDPKPTVAPDVTKKIMKDFNLAMNPNARPAPAATAENPSAPVTDGSVTAAAAPPTAAAPLALQDVQTADPGTSGSSSVMTVAPASSGGSAPAASAGIEIVSPHSGAPVDGMQPVGPMNNAPLPAIEKPAPAPDTVNDIAPAQAPPAAAAPANGKKAKPEFDKNDESSSKHKKKKGLAKINPF